jgi:hypothetical protein
MDPAIANDTCPGRIRQKLLGKTWKGSDVSEHVLHPLTSVHVARNARDSLQLLESHVKHPSVQDAFVQLKPEKVAIPC